MDKIRITSKLVNKYINIVSIDNNVQVIKLQNQKIIEIQVENGVKNKLLENKINFLIRRRHV